MRRLFVLVLVASGLSGCATPITYLKNQSTGEIVHCGGGTTGSVVLGRLGYELQKNDDDRCVADYKAKGFVPFKSQADSAAD